jgi:hypothetical protein
MESNLALKESDITIEKHHLRTSLDQMLRTLQKSSIVNLLMETSKTIPLVAQQYNLPEPIAFILSYIFLSILVQMVFL